MHTFEDFIEAIKKGGEEDQKVIKEYEETFGPISPNLEEQLWYKDYVGKFKPIKYKVPETIKDKYDWDFLLQLVMASFSSEGILEFEDGEELPELAISVYHGDKHILQRVSGLMSFQVFDVIRIYIKEQMQLQVLTKDEKERPIVESQRESRLQRWENILHKLEADRQKQAYEEQKQKKLEDLMGKL